METVVEPLEGNKVKLSVTIDEQEFEKALDATYRKFAQDVRVPGFRPGKAPRRILEARLGKEVARAEAIRTSLPEYYNEAIRDNEVDAIGSPDVDITAGEHEGPVSFDAVVEVRPQVQLAGYGGLRVTIPSPALTEEDVQGQLDRLRSNFGELVSVERPVQIGDQVTIDLKISRPGDTDPDQATTTEDVLYEVGSGSFGPQLDDYILGAVAGKEVQFVVDMEGPRQPAGEQGADPDEAAAEARQLSYDVIVKEVKEMVLPEVTDEWAGEASEFDTVAELIADIEKRLTVVKRANAQAALRSQAVEAVAELVQEDPPDALVNEDLTHRAEELENALRRQGLSVVQYLQATGRSQQQLVDDLRAQAIQSVKADLALRAVADLENLEVSDDEVDAEIVRLAERFDSKPAQVRKQLESTEQMAAVRSDVRKGKAVEWLVDHIEAVDPQGQLIDRVLLVEAPESDIEDGDTEVSAEMADAAGTT